MADNFLYDVFLSHNSKDKPRVRRIAERLRDAGLGVWFDEWNIKAGEIISLKVDEGLEQSRVLVLCVSAHALASGWVALERSTAIHRDPSNEGRRFIPVLLSDCELPDTLQRYKYVDFRTDEDAAMAELLAGCRAESSEKPPTERVPRKKAPRKPSAKQPEQLATFEGKLINNGDWVRDIAISADGSSAAVASEAPVAIWDLETGQRRKSPRKHAKGAQAVAIVPNGTLVLYAAIDGIHIWDAEREREIATWTVNTRVKDIALRSDGNQLLSVHYDCLKLWSIPENKCILSITNTIGLYSGAVSDDGELAIGGGIAGELEVWNLHSAHRIALLKGHSDSVNSVQITKDKRYAISGSEDCTVRIWDLLTNTCVGTLEGHEEAIDSVAIDGNGTLIASTGFIDSTVRLWDRESGACVEIIQREDFSPISVAFSPDGSRLIVGTTDKNLYIYRIAKRSISRTPTRRYVNAKVVLLGEGTVGKTSLAHRLIEDKYVIRDRTHGMNVWPLQLPLPHDATIEREALLWDLAGQEDYRLIHQLFLDETALALLLVNPQKDDPFAEAGDWLKALKAVSGKTDGGREIPRLLVFSQVDVGRMKLGDAKIERFRAEYGFADWLPTSAKTGENCSDEANSGNPSQLKQLIAKSIQWEHLPWTSTPRVLAELKSAMISMRDTADIRLVRFAELMQRLEQQLPEEKFGESDVRTAVTLLGNQGLARMLKFGDLVLLQPELLNGYAGAIIRAARKHTDEIGAVLESDIYNPDFDFTGVERLKHRPDEELLLRALVQTFLDHSLCIAEDTPHGRHLVFPSQYRREKDIPHDPDIFVSYTFSGEWQTVWTTLVVRLWYSQEFAHKELWRNAAEFASPKGFTLGLKLNNKQGEGTATVSLYFDKEVTDELKAIFIEYVHRHLAKYGCEVTRDRRYLCADCGSSVKDLDAVRKRLNAKKDFIYCQTCDEKVPLIDFIEQRLKSDPVARKILAMDQAATHELDTQALEQILIGHMMATCGEANQIFRPLTMFDYGIDGEVEFKDDNGKASGKRIYIQLKSGNSYLRTRKRDGTEVFDVKDERHLEYWTSQPVDVYLVIRQTDELTGAQTIRWMNVTRYLTERKDKKKRQIVFNGEKLDMEAVWKVRDQFFPPKVQRRK